MVGYDLERQMDILSVNMHRFNLPQLVCLQILRSALSSILFLLVQIFSPSILADTILQSSAGAITLRAPTAEGFPSVNYMCFNNPSVYRLTLYCFFQKQPRPIVPEALEFLKQNYDFPPFIIIIQLPLL